nr:PREDICTED: coiled-coil domain-containing protein 106-like isoform X2 [Latimeria chalumnae]|eukprot:XP_014343356.1 PREDICTED: coiled-coil domain-containing protein 106-like isoform X2 [Latimeria chalumnae]
MKRTVQIYQFERKSRLQSSRIEDHPYLVQPGIPPLSKSAPEPTNRPVTAPKNQVSLTQNNEAELVPSVQLKIASLQNKIEVQKEEIKHLLASVEELKKERDFLREQLKISISRLSKGESNQGCTELSNNSLESGSDGEDSESMTSSSSDLPKRQKHSYRKKKKTRKSESSFSRVGVQQVVKRYKKALKLYQKYGSMAKAYGYLNVDRNTIVNTAPIAELFLADSNKFEQIGALKPSKETLRQFAARCADAIDESIKMKIDAMKEMGHLLPISVPLYNKWLFIMN